MLLESGGELDRNPAHRSGDDLGQDRPASPAERTVLGRAAVAGRTFWSGAIESLGDTPIDARRAGGARRAGLPRPEPRSTIRGEEAYRFKHVLIRDVAYAGLSKSSRALLHRRWPHWLAGRTVADELVEIRAYHLDESAQLDVELEGRVPPDLAADAAAALEQAGRRALAREANAVARRLLVRAVELEDDARAPVSRCSRGLAADGHPDRLDRDARRQRRGRAAGDRRIEGRALTVLAQVALYRDADNRLRPRAREPRARGRRGRTTTWSASTRSRCSGSVVLVGGRPRGGRAPRALERLAIAERIGRCDLAERRAARAQRCLQPAARAGTRARAARARDRARGREREPDDARLDAARGRAPGGARGAARRGRGVARAGPSDLFTESGAALTLGRTLNWLGLVALERGDLPRAEELLRQAIRDPEAARGPGNARREPAPACAGAARAGTTRRGGALRARGARDRRRRGRLARARRRDSRSASSGPRRGETTEAEQLLREADEMLRADRLPAPSDRPARGPGRVPAGARPRRRGDGGRGDAGRADRRAAAAPP